MNPRCTASRVASTAPTTDAQALTPQAQGTEVTRGVGHAGQAARKRDAHGQCQRRDDGDGDENAGGSGQDYPTRSERREQQQVQQHQRCDGDHRPGR